MCAQDSRAAASALVTLAALSLLTRIMMEGGSKPLMALPIYQYLYILKVGALRSGIFRGESMQQPDRLRWVCRHLCLCRRPRSTSPSYSMSKPHETVREGWKMIYQFSDEDFVTLPALHVRVRFFFKIKYRARAQDAPQEMISRVLVTLLWPLERVLHNQAIACSM